MKRINLLFSEDKTLLSFEKMRLVAFRYGFMFILIIGAVSAGLVIVRSYAGNIVADAAKGIQEQRLDPALSRFNVLRGEIQLVNEAVQKITDFDTKKRLFAEHSKILEEFVPKDILIQGFTLERTGNTTLFGIAPTRESFLRLKSNLENSDAITQVQSPLENILQSKEIRFSLQFIFR